MYKTFFVFAGMLILAMLVLRSHMYSIPVSQLADTPISEVTGAGFTTGLPPSGFRPGHLLRDTLKNDAQHEPPYMDIGRYAFRQYLASPRSVRESIQDNLNDRIQPLPQWMAWLRQAQIDFLCIGESHQDNYRVFLAEQFLPNYPLDTLFLEARHLPATFMQLRTDIGEDEVALLSADIAAVIRATKAANPESWVIGIEESSSQESERRSVGYGSRDQSLYQNIVENYRADSKHAALLGALHCNAGWDWLYTRLEKPGSALSDARLLNIRLMNEHKDLLSREFTRFLRLMGYANADYVIAEPLELHPLVHAWFLNLSSNLVKYQGVIVFDTWGTES